MKFQKRILIQTILLISFSSCLTAAEDWIYLHENLPQELQRLAIPLKFEKSDSAFYERSQSNIKATEQDESKKKDAYKYQFDLGKAIDGNQYLMMIKDADINFLNSCSSSERPCMARIVCMKDKKSETINEGVLFFHHEIKIPLKVSTQQIVIPTKEPISTNLEISVYRDEFPYEARCNTELKGSVTGSVSAKKAFVDVSLTCKDSTLLTNRSIDLSLKPFNEQMSPASCEGKISDTFKLGKAKVVVEKIASDSSELVLAVLDGDLESNIIVSGKPEDLPVAVGQPFPSFARVDLVKRQLFTLEDFKREAGADGYIALIFGDLKIQTPEFFGRPPMMNLSLDEKMISDTLKKDIEKPVVLCFVCQQLSIGDLYEKWLGNEPEFFVLSDFSNPLNVRFQTMMRGPMFPPFAGPNEETLRGKLKFAKDKVVTALLDSTGQLVYLNTDAGAELSGSLLQMNNLIKQGKKSEKDQKPQIQN